MNKKIVVGLFFGGRSVEHEISVISALQAYENFDRTKYEIVSIYVSKNGDFYTGEKFLNIKNYKDIDSVLVSSQKIIIGRKSSIGGFFVPGILTRFVAIDIAFPLFHGSFGEDGCIQGVFESYQIPYVGLNVTGAALGMDKILQKGIYKELGFGVGKYIWFHRNEWFADSEKILEKFHDKKSGLQFPVFVKPALIGSSIGVSKASDEESLSFAIEVATTYSEKILVEQAFPEDVIEVNCSAMGYGLDIKASVCEQPVKSADLLSFADKYQKAGGKGSKRQGMVSLSRVIPAPISKNLAADIQSATIKIFEVFDGCGVARIDFFVDKKQNKFWVNELNSPPGSLAYYLWEKSGTPYTELLDKLIGFAQKRFEEQKKTQYSFNSGVLS